jgi:hypothetical protein
MKGRHWCPVSYELDDILTNFLEEKVESVQRRIFETTGVTVEPVYYSAGYTDGKEKQNPYNLSKLLYYILMAVPAEKRLLVVDKLNTVESNWEANDRDYTEDVTEAITEGFWASLLKGVGVYAEKGALIGGCVIGIPGMVVGGLVGAICGGLRSLIGIPLSES